jgi:putative hemolysin
MTIGVTAVLLVVGLVFSALFSGVETALTALPFARVSALAKRGGRARRWAWRRWSTRPQRALTAILAGNTLVNVGLSAVVTDTAVGLLGDRGIALAIGFTTLAVLTFGEVTPKALARTKPEGLAKVAIVPVAVFEWLLTPVTVPLLAFSHLVARIRKISLEHTATASRPEDVRFLLSIARKEGHVSEQQHAMLEAVLRLEEADVRDVQKPRTDVVFLPDTLAVEEVRATVVARGYSRYPVYHGRDDNVIGILLAKDLLKPQASERAWTALLQAPLFVPESKRVVDLLREMRERRTHIALSVDEHGNVAGLVTLEDLLETIVGDIQDEFDTAKPLAQREGPDIWLVRGALPLERLARLTGRAIPAEPDYASVAGLILDLAGRVPAVGSRFTVGGLALEVVEASTRRIELVRVTTAAPPA